MLSKHGLVSLAVVFLLACGGSSPPTEAPEPDQPAARVLEADTPSETPKGATFTAPKDWSLTADGPMALLATPEPGSQIAIIDVDAADADAAMAAAWVVYGAVEVRTLELATEQPGRDGWQEVKSFSYETSPNEKMVVGAAALRFGKQWTVVIIEMKRATIGKRGAQVALINQSLRPKGYSRESFAGKKSHPLTPERIKLLEEFVEMGQKELGIPGVALALIDDGKVVLSRGFGVRELGKKEPIDADTRFLVASNTKSLTTLMLATLVEEGTLTWATPVADVFKGFKLGGPETTARVQIKHLVCACTGLPRQDFEWIFEFAGGTPKASVELLGTMEPTSDFGEMYQYSNPLAAAAGFVGGHVLHPDKELGAAYDAAMQARVFDPLGMKSATFDFKVALAGNVAQPHAFDADSNVAVVENDFNYAIVAVRPAGGLWASVRDLTHYVQMELANGKLPDGSQLISAKNLLERRVPQVTYGEHGSYGMGLSVNNKWDVEMLMHGGSMAGYKTQMYWLPEHGVGAVLLTNSDSGGNLLGPFRRRLLEVLFDGKPEAEEDVRSAAKTRNEWAATERARLTIPADPKTTDTLAAAYANPHLGRIDIANKDGDVTLDVGEWKTGVATRANEDGTVSVIATNPILLGFPFVVGEADGKRTLTVRDAQHEYVFTETDAK